MARRKAAVALTGSALLLTAATMGPADATIAPPTTPPSTPGTAAAYTPADPLATATLALCVGDQPGATNYLYAEGPSYVPSTNQQLTVPPSGVGPDCRAYPVEPGQYYIATFKYPRTVCTTDDTREGGKKATVCFAKVHHIHVSHELGVIVSNTAAGAANTNPYLGSTPPTPTITGLGTTETLTPVLVQDATSPLTPNCTAVNGTESNESYRAQYSLVPLAKGGTAPLNGCAQTPVVDDGYSNANGEVYGLEYNNPQWPDDTIIEQQTVLVTIHAGETVQVAAHTTDHRAVDCWTGYDSDPNGNPPVCN